MPVESHFVDAIRENPDDRTLRLIYADWLDDIGDARGRLIRLQCELDGMPLGDPHRHVLQHAIRELCRDHQSEWLAPLRRRVLGWQHARFHFGLVENVSMSPTAFLKHSESGLFEEMPHLVGVALEGSEKPMAKALDSPAIARLSTLKISIYDVLRGQVIDRLASATAVNSLTSLDLENGRFGDAAITGVLQSSQFTKLRRLNLQNNGLTSNIVRPLLDSPMLPQLEMLALGTRWEYGVNKLEDIGVRQLAESSPPLRLRWLDLSANQLSDSSAWDLARSSCLKRIECLYLGGNTFGPASRTALNARFSNRVFYARCEPECACQ